MSTLTPNFNLIKPDENDLFELFRQWYNDNLDIIDANLGGGGGSGGHTIIDQLGQDMPQRTGLQIIGASVTDDSVNDRTVVTITGGGGGSVNYSLAEQVIGTWIDGKPLYQKTIDCGNLPNTGSKSVNHGISDLKKVLSCECMFDASTWGGNIPFLSMTGSTLSQAGCIAITYSTTALSISAGSNRSGCTAYATLRYTKTTD